MSELSDKNERMASAIESTYGKCCKVTTYKEDLTRTCILTCGAKVVRIVEHQTSSQNTDHVVVSGDCDEKTFYQGIYQDGSPGEEPDYHGFNAYLEAEKYAMESL